MKRKIGRWAAGALCALLMPLALAQPPHRDSGAGGGFGGGFGGDFGRGHGFGVAPGGRDVWQRRMPAAAGPRNEGPRSGGGYGPRWGLRPTPSYGPSYGRLPPRMPNPYRAVSADARQVPRPPGNMNMPLRAGSIRADVARYNEERVGRPMPPPRSMEEPTRSPLFSPYFRN